MTIQINLSDPNQKVGTDFCQVKTEMTQKIEYWEEYGPQGKTLPHSLGSDVKPIPWGKMTKKEFTPGYFKEKLVFGEDDLLKLSQMADEFKVITIEDMVGKGLRRLTARARNLINWAIWQAVMTGEVKIDENGVKYTATYGIPAQNLALTVATAWATLASSKPLKDITAVIQSFLGTGYKLGKIKMNSYTADLIVHSTDTKTYWNGIGIKEKLTLGNIEKNAQELTPGTSWEVNDDGYTNDAGTFSIYIPNNKVLFLGNAPDLMDYCAVPHLENGRPVAGSDGIFAVPDYKHLTDPNPYAEIFGGTYGLPRIYRPTIIFVMDVTQTS
jgi:hypothetical protein